MFSSFLCMFLYARIHTFFNDHVSFFLNYFEEERERVFKVLIFFFV